MADDDLEQGADGATARAEAARAVADAADLAEEEPDKEPASDQYIEQNGNRYVRSEALRSTRDKLKAVRKTAAELKEKAAKYDMVQPYLGLLATHPEIKRQARGSNADADDGRDDGLDDGRDRDRRPRRLPEPPPIVTDFDDVIESLGIDPAAGRKLATLVTHIADRCVGKGVAPVAEVANRSSAQQARQRAYAATDSKGELYATREAIDDVFSRIPEHMLANDDFVVKAALVQARGLGGPGKPSEPLHTEDTGSRGGRRGGKTDPLTPIERALMGQHNMTEEEWREDSRQDTLLLE